MKPSKCEGKSDRTGWCCIKHRQEWEDAYLAEFWEKEKL
jgi:hypothetical protein